MTGNLRKIKIFVYFSVCVLLKGKGITYKKENQNYYLTKDVDATQFMCINPYPAESKLLSITQSSRS